ncbi:MAG: anaerobic ribonucleoside-triphosphate reductase, partial [Oceanisphaera sp.]|nr:anaerobic ribonucleoside-triphosphate reductase [Oceanisphaera sp.]
LDKFLLHGKSLVQYLDGGSALHLNLDEHLSRADYLQLYRIAATTGCHYFTVNVRTSICNDCGHIDKQTVWECAECGSENVDHATRVIGYLKRVSSFSAGRRAEHSTRFYHG